MQIFRIPKTFPFLVTIFMANFIDFLLLPNKVYADAINDLQYRVTKMHTKSEKHIKYWHAIIFSRNVSTKTRYQEKTALKMNRYG